ncbi:uncharacterized protein LOC103379862 isoform X2 [Cynoglossus semilaevis]|nr:uncharacterized protein LOC103379862 isoform X2 [Cynoglossus semilaevis]
MLLSMEANIVLPETSVYYDIRDQIEKMNRNMEESQWIALNELHHIDGETERLTAKLRTIMNQKKQSESELSGFKIDVKSHKSSLQNYADNLETEEENLKELLDKIKEMEREKQEGGAARAFVGGFLIGIPIVGWAAGYAVLNSLIKEQEQMSEAVNKAKEEVKRCKSQIERYTEKVAEYKSKIHKAECDIHSANVKIHDSEATLRDVSVKRRIIADVQEKLRCAIVQLEQLGAVGSVAELQTRYLIMVEPLMKVMEEMTTVLGQISGGDLLHREGILYLMNNIKRNHRKLLEHQIKPDAHADWMRCDDNDYY